MIVNSNNPICIIFVFKCLIILSLIIGNFTLSTNYCH